MTTQKPQPSVQPVAAFPAAQTPAITAFSWLLIIATPALWSVNYLVARKAPAFIAPHALAFARWGLAAILLSIFAWPELKAKRHLIWAERWRNLALGMLGMWICGAWVYLGARTTSANNIALIYALSPVFIALAAALFLKEHLRKRQWMGVAMALIGLVHVVIQGHWGTIAKTEFVAGDGWILGCAIAWAVYSIGLKRWPSSFSPLARLVLIAASGALFTLPLALLEAISGLAYSQTAWGWTTLAIVVAAAVFPSSGAYLAYATLQKRIGASNTALVLYLGPLYAALLAWFVLGEPLHSYHAIGALIILPGIYLASQSSTAS
jgi:drug/metabolite transporter (DMT)-like permease